MEVWDMLQDVWPDHQWFKRRTPCSIFQLWDDAIRQTISLGGLWETHTAGWKTMILRRQSSLLRSSVRWQLGILERNFCLKLEPRSANLLRKCTFTTNSPSLEGDNNHFYHPFYHNLIIIFMWLYELIGRYGEWYFFRKKTGLQNQSVLYKKRGLEEEEEVLLDINLVREDGTASLDGTW